MERSTSFGQWLRRRRKALDLTQDDLARCAGCAVGTIKSIEGDERRPSKQLAARLAECLEVEQEVRTAFIKAARAELAVDRLPLSPPPPASAITAATTARPMSAGPSALPSGTITFFFSDIEGSTRLWEQQSAAMQEALTRHDAILRQAIPAHGGVIFKTVGDAFHAAFTRAPDALAAAITIQRALHREPWGATGPLRVRMALHTGVAEERDGDYFGSPLNRVARLMATGHGNQILLTRTTQELVRDDLPPDVELRDLGMHRLKDLTRPEQVFQVVTPDLPAAFPLLNTLDARPHNLPVQPTSLIGREVEVAEVCDLVRRSNVRLVTLNGPGGVGKTRLALQVAAELLDDFADGVWFINLAPITEPAFAANIIAQTLGVRESSGQTLIDTLKAFLRAKQVLLLVDNFEHIVEAAPLLAELLAMAPSLKVLVTSRMPLHLSGEREFAVPPLALPDRKQPVELEHLTQYEAVRLFIDRAQAVKPDFTVTNATAPAVAEICYRLDGLPLAIELAAARAKLFPPKALLARLSSRLKFLTGVVRDLPARQQTLRNTIAWSYHLLDKDETTLFTRLGVFVGGCTLGAAEAVCNADGDLPMEVVEGIAVLLDKSLLRQEEGSDGEPRVTMLETIREYALERLESNGEIQVIRGRHRDWFLRFVEEAEAYLYGPEQVAWYDRLEVEHNNLRAALEWCQLEPESAEVGLQFVGVLGQFWLLRGFISEGRERLAIALARPAAKIPSTARATALRYVGDLTRQQGAMDTARAYYEESLTISRAIKDNYGIAESLGKLGTVSWMQGHYEQAAALHAERLDLCRELEDQRGVGSALFSLGLVAEAQGDYARAVVLYNGQLDNNREQGNKIGVAACLTNLGAVLQYQGDYEQAAALHSESLDLYRQLGDKDGIALAILNLGYVAAMQGDYAQAASHFMESLELHRELGDQQGITECIKGLAGIAGAQDSPERAARLLGSAEALFEAIGVVPDPAERADYDRIRTATRAQLDEATFAAAWAAGRAMSIEQAISYALDEGT